MANDLKIEKYPGNLLTNLGTKFVKDLKAVVQQVLKLRMNKNSDLSESVEFVYGRTDNLYMYANDYYQNVSKGRKPLARKIPIHALISWIKQNGFSSTRYSANQLAFALQNAIYKNGIRGKNFIEQIEKAVGDITERQLADNLEKVIADSLYASFQIK